MFGRKQDENDGDKRNEDGEGEAAETTSAEETAEATEEPVASADSFAEGIRVDAPTRRPRQTEAGSDKPVPAVPPSAGGAHRSAVYRTAPDESRQDESPQDEPSQSETAAPAPAATTSEPAMDGDPSKRLTVGNGIVLKGEISNCDALVVEGTVEANLSDSRKLMVGQTGVLKGTVEVEEATVAGQFEGTLVVSNVLSIKSGGQVRGEVRYGSLQVEAGGVLSGTADTTVVGKAGGTDSD